jgi:hypothetical protein
MQEQDIEGARQALEETQDPLQQAREQQMAAGEQQEEQPAETEEAGEQQVSESELPTPQGNETVTELPDEQTAEQQEQMAEADQQAAEQQEDVAEEQQEEAAAEQEMAPTGESPLAAMPASDVIGADVVNAEGQTVADIVDLVKKTGEEDLYAVLSVGGFLGIGDKKVVVPINDLDVTQDGQIVMANASEDQLKNMPTFEEEGYETAQQQ